MLGNDISLEERMKRYENVSRNYLTRRVPVIARIDGKSFHSVTKGLVKPFDKNVEIAMQLTMQSLCEEVQGCVFGYTQSDEITLVITDYETIITDAWFGYNIQKMASVLASTATFYFNRYFSQSVRKFLDDDSNKVFSSEEDFKQFQRYREILMKKLETGALFDARVFSIPKDEVANSLIWGQQDGTRNNIEGAARYFLGANRCMNRTQYQLIEMMKNAGVDYFSRFTSSEIYGSACYKVEQEVQNQYGVFTRNKWIIDYSIPNFSKNREFIEKFL